MAVKTVKVYCKSNYVVIENSYGEDGPYTGYLHDAHEDHEVVFDDGPDYLLEDTFETDLEEPYLVYVIYSTGGTFGRTDGYFRALGLFSLEDAILLQNLVNKSADLERYSKSEEDERNTVRKELKKFGVTYDFWNGYFERLQDVVVLKVT